MADYYVESTSGEELPLHPSLYSGAKIDEALRKVIEEDVGGGVFWAEYGVTTFAEIAEAYETGKMCAVKYLNNVYVLSYFLENQTCYFSRGASIAAVTTSGVTYDAVMLETLKVLSDDSWTRLVPYAEPSYNRVMELSDDSTHVKFPTAKAVVDYVAANGGVFWATYDSTTLAEVTEAYSAGKICAVKNGLYTYVLTMITTSSARFNLVNWTVVKTASIRACEVSASGWTSLEMSVDSNELKVQTISDSDTASQYPSSPAVQAYVAPVEDTALKSYVTPTTSGAIASIDDGAEDIPVKSLIVDIEPVQSGSGDPSPDNVRPISGWTGVNVQRTGKNLLDGASAVNGYISSAGNYISSSKTTNQTVLDYIPVSGDVTVSANTTFHTIGLAWYANDKSFISREQIRDISSATRTPPTGAAYVIVFASLDQTAETVWSFLSCEIQLERGSTATDYEPYQGNSYAIDWTDEAGTVYGGTLDVTTGVLTVDRMGKTFDGTETWGDTGTENTNVWLARFRVSYKVEGSDRLCSHLPNASVMVSNTNIGFFAYNSTTINVGGGLLQFRVDGIQNLEDFVSWVQEQYANGTPLQCVFGRAEPLTYQLTPTEVTTLLGVNNIYADTGDSSVTYRADPTLIYEKITAAIAAMTGGA